MIAYRLARFDVAAVFILGVILSIAGLGNHEFVQFESRFGLFAQEMLRNGISFFPTTYNHFYPDYPATQTIFTYLFSLPFHKVTILAAVLPTAIATGITLVFTYLLALTQSQRLAIYSVILSLFTFAFLAASRTISIDQFTAAATVVSFYSAYTNRRLWLILLCLILGFAFRGPIGLIIPAAVVGGFYLLEHQYKKFFIHTANAIVLLAVCLFLLLVAAQHAGGKTFVHEVLHMQILGRMGTNNDPPFYYYLGAAVTNYAISFPIACLVLAANFKNLWRTPVNPTLRLIRHLGFWLVIILVGMSIPGDKKVRYILAITPAITIIAAYLFTETQHPNWLLWIKRYLTKICLLLPYLGILLITACILRAPIPQTSLGIYYLVAVLLFGIQIIVTNVWINRLEVTNPQRELLSLIVGVAAFVTTYICVAQPINNLLNQNKPFATQVEILRNSQQALVFYGIGPDGDDIKYMVAIDKPLRPIFLQTPTALMNFKSPAIFIATEEQFKKLTPESRTNFRMLYSGNLGRTPCIAFTWQPMSAATALNPPKQ